MLQGDSLLIEQVSIDEGLGRRAVRLAMSHEASHRLNNANEGLDRDLPPGRLCVASPNREPLEPKSILQAGR